MNLSPFQFATVEHATRHVARDVREGRSIDACMTDVLGQIDHPSHAERDAARAIVRASYPGQAPQTGPRPGETLRSPWGGYLGRA